MSLTIRLDKVTRPAGMRQIFRTENSWSVFRSGERYFLAFGDSSPEITSEIAATYDSQIDDITLFCSPDVNKARTIPSPLHYPLDQILLIQYLSRRDGAIVHAAGFSVNGKGYIFPGVSGAGKSTITRILLKKEKAVGLSDDRIIVRKLQSSILMFGTPWPGDAEIAENKSAPLNGIFFLVQSTGNRIEQISPAEAFRRFMPVSSIPWYDRDAVAGMLSFFEELISRIPSYLFHFTRDNGAADCFEEFINGQ